MGWKGIDSIIWVSGNEGKNNMRARVRSRWKCEEKAKKNQDIDQNEMNDTMCPAKYMVNKRLIAQFSLFAKNNLCRGEWEISWNRIDQRLF
jgi:hypothetical protein